MDVDLHMSSASKRLLTSSPDFSMKKRAKIILPQAQLTAFNSKMTRHSSTQVWQYRIEKARDDDSLWRYLLSDVLMFLTRELAATDMKSSVIASPNLERADDIVKGFNKDELEQWKAGVQNGVEKNDWTDLIVHRTSRLPLISF
jgi:hypothetical protein